jgi:hypothetical protein
VFRRPIGEIPTIRATRRSSPHTVWVQKPSEAASCPSTEGLGPARNCRASITLIDWGQTAGDRLSPQLPKRIEVKKCSHFPTFVHSPPGLFLESPGIHRRSPGVPSSALAMRHASLRVIESLQWDLETTRVGHKWTPIAANGSRVTGERTRRGY